MPGLHEKNISTSPRSLLQPPDKTRTSLQPVTEPGLLSRGKMALMSEETIRGFIFKSGI